MRRRFPLLIRLLLSFAVLLVVPSIALVGITQYQQRSVRLDVERKVESTLDLAIHMEESLLKEGLTAMRDVAVAVATDPLAAGALLTAGAPFDIGRYNRAFSGADLLLLLDRSGVVVARATSDSRGDRVTLDGLVQQAINEAEALAYPGLITAAELRNEGDWIREQVDMPIFETGLSTESKTRAGSRVDTALALMGVAPVRSAGGEILGAVVAADILNKDFRIVDEVERWSPPSTPINATIALDGVRISTNVKLTDPEGNPTFRAIGTMYSDVVMETLRAGGIYRGRAVVVDKPHRAIYKPMTDFRGQVIAGAYVGIPEAVFTQVGAQVALWTRLIFLGGGSLLLLVGVLLLLWLRHRVIAPIQAVTNRLRRGGAPEAELHGENDELGDLFGAMEERLMAQSSAAARITATAVGLDRSGAILLELAGRTTNGVNRALASAAESLAAAAELRDGGGQTLERLTELAAAVRAVSDGVRREERSIQYVAKVTQDVAEGLGDSQTHAEATVQDIARLTAAARTAIRQVGDFTAGMALLRQDLQAIGHQSRALELLRDPSDLLQNMASLTERVAEEVRSLVLVIQENQARLAFVQEEMARVGGVVHTTATQTQQAADTAAGVISWLESTTGRTVITADGMICLRGQLQTLTTTSAELRNLCHELNEQLRSMQM